jgi:hypothetical protein
VPDLFVLTVHPGYHSFYSFVLDEYWRRDDLPRSCAVWRCFYRSKELIFSIACNTCEHPDYGGEFANIVESILLKEGTRRAVMTCRQSFQRTQLSSSYG